MKKIDQKFLNEFTAKANHLPRKRLNYNFHNDSSDVLQRMLNTWTADSYVRPHKHDLPAKREAWVILQGKAVVVEFDEEGQVTEHAILGQGQDENLVIEIEPGKWHTIITLEPDTVVYEVKDGPYEVKSDKIFAPWAPSEDSSSADLYRQDLLKQLGFFSFVFHQEHYF